MSGNCRGKRASAFDLPRKARQRLRQRGAGQHVGADRGHQLAHRLLLALLDHHGQRIGHRQLRAQQRRELARDHRQLGLRQPAAERQAGARLLRFVQDRLDRQRHQAATAQQLARHARGVGFEDAAGLLAVGVGGGVAEGGHGSGAHGVRDVRDAAATARAGRGRLREASVTARRVGAAARCAQRQRRRGGCARPDAIATAHARAHSRVTRSTSSFEVIPAATQRMPSARIGSIPAFSAMRRMSVSLAPLWTSSRRSSSTVSSS